MKTNILILKTGKKGPLKFRNIFILIDNLNSYLPFTASAKNPFEMKWREVVLCDNKSSCFKLFKFIFTSHINFTLIQC